MKRFVVIDADGVAVNLVLWDGSTEWSPPEGCTVALEDSDEARAALAAADAAQADASAVD